MFFKYQIEIIAMLLIVIALVVYVIIYKRKSKINKDKYNIINSMEEVEAHQKIKVENLKNEQEAQKEKQNDLKARIIQSLEGSEEGDFGTESTQEKQTKAVCKQPTIQTRDVPPHGKIVKQNFEEFSGMRVLVAEDNIINQKVISGLLSDSGIGIVIANNGQEVLNILEDDDDFVMILMDAHMPVLDGFGATRAIRDNPQYDHIVVIALSGDTAADDVKKMTNAGMAQHLEKPLRMDRLYDIFYAYSGPKENTSNSGENNTKVASNQVLNKTEGLAICGGDETFYLEILHEFIDTYAISDRELHRLLTNSQMAMADKLLLDIIGVAANIGAHPLYNIATLLKNSLKDTKKKSYFKILEEYQTHLKAVVKEIKAFINR